MTAPPARLPGTPHDAPRRRVANATAAGTSGAAPTVVRHVLASPADTAVEGTREAVVAVGIADAATRVLGCPEKRRPIVERRLVEAEDRDAIRGRLESHGRRPTTRQIAGRVLGHVEVVEEDVGTILEEDQLEPHRLRRRAIVIGA